MEFALLALLMAIVWYWFDSMAKRERAILLGRELATRFNLQLLDETVNCKQVWLKRNARGHIQLLRTFAFEVSANGADRMPCHLTLLSNQLLDWHIPPYEQPF